MDDDCVIRRFVEGISLNGYEYLLTDDRKLMIFSSVELAETFLAEYNIPLDEVDIVPYSILINDMEDKDVNINKNQ
jgi:hypothetical protein